jgi:hypothetical protein
MYREKEIANLGTLKFLGNLGAVAMFEDYVGESYLERVLVVGKKARIGDIVKLIFFSYKVACKKLDLPIKFTMEDFEDNIGTSLAELSSELFADINKELGIGDEKPEPQKKMKASK